MTKPRSFLLLALSMLAFATACAEGDASLQPDAGGGGPPPVTVQGTYAVHSRLTLAAPPAEIGDVVAALRAATDGPEDPSRYLVDLVIARLPDGDTKRLAQFLAPSIATYVQAKIDEIAPALAPGLRALAAGLARLSTELGFRETLVIDAHGGVRRTLTMLEVDGRVVDIAPVSGDAQAVLEEPSTGRRIVVSAHALEVDYGQLLRRGFDRAVIPAVVPDAIDLGGALATLVDCARLGALLADHVGLGSPSLYAHACTFGLAAAAAEIDAWMPRDVPLTLALRGAARAVDTDRDGQIDTLQAGVWEGDGVRGSFGGNLRAAP